MGESGKLVSDLDINLQAKLTERLKVNCESSVDKTEDEENGNDDQAGPQSTPQGADSTPGDNGDGADNGGNSLAVSVAVIVALVDNSTRAVVGSGSSLDASRDTIIKAEIV